MLSKNCVLILTIIAILSTGSMATRTYSDTETTDSNSSTTCTTKDSTDDESEEFDFSTNSSLREQSIENDHAILIAKQLIVRNLLDIATISLQLRKLEQSQMPKAKMNRQTKLKLKEYVKNLTELGSKADIEAIFSACPNVEGLEIVSSLLRARLELANLLLGHRGYYEKNDDLLAIILEINKDIAAELEDALVQEFRLLFTGFLNNTDHQLKNNHDLPRQLPRKFRAQSRSALDSAFNWLRDATDLARAKRDTQADIAQGRQCARSPRSIVLPPKTALKQTYVITCKFVDGLSIGLARHEGDTCIGEDGRRYSVALNGIGPALEGIWGPIIITIRSPKQISPAGTYVGMRGGLGLLLGSSVGGFINVRKRALAGIVMAGAGVVSVTLLVGSLVISEEHEG